MRISEQINLFFTAADTDSCLQWGYRISTIIFITEFSTFKIPPVSLLPRHGHRRTPSHQATDP